MCTNRWNPAFVHSKILRHSSVSLTYLVYTFAGTNFLKKKNSSADRRIASSALHRLFDHGQQAERSGELCPFHPDAFNDKAYGQKTMAKVWKDRRPFAV
jgi:hypothetical protein